MTAANTSWPGLFIDHPIRPLMIRDPLAIDPQRVPTDSVVNLGETPRIGFAALWEPVPERTWSGSALHLYQGLLRAADTTDIGIHMSRLSLTAFKAIHTRYHYGRLWARWNYSRLTDTYLERTLQRAAHSKFNGRNYDAILTIDTLADPHMPFFVFYDISWEAMITSAESASAYAEMRGLKLSVMNHARDHQQEIYERATGIIATSNWFARSLIEQSGIASEKVYVAHPGFSSGCILQDGRDDGNRPPGNSGMGPRRVVPVHELPRRKLLFVGRQNTPSDFYRKGGDLVVAALEILRREYDPEITLSMAGMDYWPLQGTPPLGVRMLGSVSPSQVSALYDSHDLFVMPSRMEPFGIVFAEALAHGIPCIARDAYAMPEIVTPGVSGALITTDDPNELAATIASVLGDDALYESCRKRAPQMAAYFSWGRTGRDVARIID